MLTKGGKKTFECGSWEEGISISEVGDENCHWNNWVSAHNYNVKVMFVVISGVSKPQIPMKPVHNLQWSFFEIRLARNISQRITITQHAQPGVNPMWISIFKHVIIINYWFSFTGQLSKYNSSFFQCLMPCQKTYKTHLLYPLKPPLKHRDGIKSITNAIAVTYYTWSF